MDDSAVPVVLPQSWASPPKERPDGRLYATPSAERPDRFSAVLPVVAQPIAAVPGPGDAVVGTQEQSPSADLRQVSCANLANLSASEAKPWVSLIG